MIIGHRSSESTYAAKKGQSHHQTKKQETKKLLQVSGEGLVLKPIQVGDDDEDGNHDNYDDDDEDDDHDENDDDDGEDVHDHDIMSS